MSKKTPIDPAPTLEAKRKTRDDAIERLCAGATSRGQKSDRSYWSMVYDFELAPMTSNRRQLEELGIDCPKTAADVASLDDECVVETLRSIVDGLALLSVYLLHTDHLGDRQLLSKLVAEIIDEEVRDLPADGTAREIIDLCIPETNEEWANFEAHYGDEGNGRRASVRDATLPRPGGDGSD